MKTLHFSKKALPFFIILLFVLSLSLVNSNLMIGRPKFVLADTTEAPISKALTYRGSAQANGLFSSGLSVTLPDTIQQGDLLIAVAGTNGPASSWVSPDGWTQGANSGSTGAQGLTWWWKVADGSEAGTGATFQSESYADGGIVVNVYHGQAADPIAGVSGLTTSDNFGNGHVTSADVSGVGVGEAVTAVPLLLVSFQPNAADITWPQGIIFESTSTDGYSSVAVAEALSSQTTDTFSGYTLPVAPGEAIVQTLQVLVRM